MNNQEYKKVAVFDAGIFGNRYHTYIFNNKLFRGEGYQSHGWSDFTYEPKTDKILIDDISNIDLEELKKIYK